MKRSHFATILLLLYGLSGITALAYEVLWTRMLSLLFGISILGVVVTVAAFMLGLGLGSFMACRWRFSLRLSLYLLAAIEIGVAVYALCLPTSMHVLQTLYLSVDDLAVWQFWQISSALWVLCLPAMALGFAFPTMLRLGKSFGVSLSALYGVNTVGGALGALLPLLLLPVFGWMAALQWVAGLGVFVGLLMLCLALYGKREIARLDDAMSFNHTLKLPHITKSRLLPYMDLWAYAGLGAGALMLEVAWTRAYGMILLRTEYVLAVILSVFLVGIGLGSILAKYLPAARALRWMPGLVAIMAIAGLYAFPYINSWGQSVSFDTLFAALLFQGLLIALCTLPVTLLFGAWLPLIAQNEGSESTELAGAWLYAANSVGACLGALLAGFVLIPWLGTAGTWLFAAALVMLCGFYWSLDRPVDRSVDRSVGAKRLLPLVGSIVLFAVFAWPVLHLPAASVLLAKELPSATDLYQREDAVSITHVIERSDGQRILLADLQRMDASSDPTSVAVQQNQARLPMFLHGNPKSVLFLGLGTGITASGALAWPQAKLSAVELSQGAIIAAQSYFDQVNAAITHKIDIYHDDARRFLMRSGAHFDVIVGDLFHPDMVGRGALLSVQQFARAKARLNQQGVFVQWLAINQFDKAALQVVLRSFAQVFPNNAVFVDGYRLALVGFHGAHQDAAYVLVNAPKDALWGGEGGWTWLGRYWGDIARLLPDNDEPLAVSLLENRSENRSENGADKVQGEWSPVIEFSLPALHYQDSSLPDVLAWLAHSRMGFQAAAKRWSVAASSLQSFKRAWAATALNMQAQLMTLQGKSGQQRLQALAYRANAKDRWAGFALADAMFASLERALPQGLSYEQALQKILRIRPDHEQALKAMVHLLHQRGDEKAVQDYKERLFRISPYARVS